MAGVSLPGAHLQVLAKVAFCTQRYMPAATLLMHMRNRPQVTNLLKVEGAVIQGLMVIGLVNAMPYACHALLHRPPAYQDRRPYDQLPLKGQTQPKADVRMTAELPA